MLFLGFLMMRDSLWVRPENYFEPFVNPSSTPIAL
jgi:hypothetical protein